MVNIQKYFIIPNFYLHKIFYYYLYVFFFINIQINNIKNKTIYKKIKIMKKILDLLVFILLFLWQLPQNIIALIMLPFLGKLKLIKYDKYCYTFEGKNMNGGISLGSFIFLSPYCAKRETTIAHEYGHVIDSHIFGPLYLFIIGIPSIFNAIFNITDCYYSWYTESRANKHAGLGIDTKCRLYFLDKPNYNKKN